MSLVPPAMSGIGPKTRRAGCRFRPLLRRTFGFRLPPTGEASSYSRPVLGAGGRLRGTTPCCKGCSKVLCRKERGFFSTGLRRPWGLDLPVGSLDYVELDLPFVPADVFDAHLNSVAEAVRPTRAAPDESRPQRVELEVVARQPARGDVALEDTVEADEDARADRADDLAFEGRVPTGLEEPTLEQPGKTKLVGAILDLGRLALSPGGPFGKV